MGDTTRNVVGAFTDEASADAAVRFLERAGLSPDDVAVVERDVRRARELSGSRSPQGAIAGGILAAVLFAAFLAMGGPLMWSDLVVVALGVGGFLVPGIAIGTLAGRSRIFVADRGGTYERAVEHGETLVSVHVADGQRDRARRLLREAGALSVRAGGTGAAASARDARGPRPPRTTTAGPSRRP